MGCASSRAAAADGQIKGQDGPSPVAKEASVNASPVRVKEANADSDVAWVQQDAPAAPSPTAPKQQLINVSSSGGQAASVMQKVRSIRYSCCLAYQCSRLVIDSTAVHVAEGGACHCQSLDGQQQVCFGNCAHSSYASIRAGHYSTCCTSSKLAVWGAMFTHRGMFIATPKRMAPGEPASCISAPVHLLCR